MKDSTLTDHSVMVTYAKHLRMRRLALIDAYIKEHDLSHSQLAADLGILEEEVTGWLERDAPITDIHIIMLADLFSVEMEYLYTGRQPLQKECIELVDHYMSLSITDRKAVDSFVELLVQMDATDFDSQKDNKI